MGIFNAKPRRTQSNAKGRLCESDEHLTSFLDRGFYFYPIKNFASLCDLCGFALKFCLKTENSFHLGLAKQHLDFLGIENRPAADFEIAQPEISNPHAEQFGDLVAQRLEHHANLALGAMVQDNFDPARGNPLDMFGLELAFFCENTGEELIEVGVFEGLVRGDKVFFFHRFRWMHELLGKITVVSKNKHAFGICIKTADMVEGAQRSGKQAVNRIAAEFVAAGADITARFVENDDDFLFRENTFAVDPDTVGFRNPGGELDARCTVHIDPAACNQFIAGTPRTNPAGSKIFIETDSL